MMASANRSDAGFTLVEVLVVLSVIGLMSGLMLTMMGQFRHLVAVDERLTDKAALQRTARHITGQLEKAESLPLVTVPDAASPFFEASEKSVRFLAVAKSGIGIAGLRDVTIVFEKKNGAGHIIESILPRRATQNDTDTVTLDLLADVESLQFTFLQHASPTEPRPVWRSDWSDIAQLPVAVRVVIQSKDKSGRPIEASAIAYIAR